MSSKPLISCLCVTRGKVQYLQRAIRCFQSQSYRNRELLILYEDDDRRTREYVAGILDRGISTAEVPGSPKLTLGRLRNLAIEKCRGEYFCQWDDDDWFHRNRLEFQMQVIQESRMPASIMMQWLVYEMSEGQAYISNRRPWEGSILCKKALIGEEMLYDDLLKGEDTNLIKSLFARSLVFPILMPKLYIYVYHGRNTWEYEHWKPIIEAGKRLTASSSRLISDILSGRYSEEEASDRLDKISE